MIFIRTECHVQECKIYWHSRWSMRNWFKNCPISTFALASTEEKMEADFNFIRIQFSRLIQIIDRQTSFLLSFMQSLLIYLAMSILSPNKSTMTFYIYADHLSQLLYSMKFIISFELFLNIIHFESMKTAPKAALALVIYTFRLLLSGKW